MPGRLSDDIRILRAFLGVDFRGLVLLAPFNCGGKMNIDHLSDLCVQAAPAPWKTRDYSVVVGPHKISGETQVVASVQSENDRQLIVAMRNSIDALLRVAFAARDARVNSRINSALLQRLDAELIKIGLLEDRNAEE